MDFLFFIVSLLIYLNTVTSRLAMDTRMEVALIQMLVLLPISELRALVLLWVT